MIEDYLNKTNRQYFSNLYFQKQENNILLLIS